MRQFPALPAGLPTSTIGSIRLNFRVRNGNGWIPYDIVTAMAECIADTFTTEEEKEEIELKTNEWGERSVSGKDNVSSLLQGFKVTFVSFCLFPVIKLSTY